MLTKELIKSYKATIYRVPSLNLDIRIGERNPKLDLVLQNENSITWAFITAWNPKSQELSFDENCARNQSLTDRLKSHDHSVYMALGIPDRGDWTPEESLFIPGISRKQAIELGLQYGQNAIVFGEFGKRAQLHVI